MRGWRWAAAMLAVLSACSDLPMESGMMPLDEVALQPAASLSSTSCDKYWTIAVDGRWDDSQRWSPAGVPVTDDVVCFEAAGVYTIVMAGNSRLAGFHVGDGAAVELTASAGQAIYADTLAIERTGRLTIVGCAGFDISREAVVYGNLTVQAPPACSQIAFDGLRIEGLLELHSTTIGHGYPSPVNRGEIRLFGNNRLSSRLMMEAGVISGTGHVTVQEFEWNGGSLPLRRADGSAALLSEFGYLRLGSTSVSGAVDMDTDSAFFPSGQIHGTIGSAVDVGVAGRWRIDLVPSNTTAFTNEGRLSTLRGDTVRLDSWFDIVNTGTIAVPVGGMLITAETVVNRGTIEVDGQLRFGSTDLENRGSIDVRQAGELVLTYSDFIAYQAGSMIGRLELRTLAGLYGNGSVGDVAVTGSGNIVSPGNATNPIGRLHMKSLSLGSGAKTVFDLGAAGQGDSDYIIVASALKYGGELEVRTLSGFTGGLCGQNLRLIHLSDSTTSPARSFNQLTGMQQTTRSQWRPYYAPHGLRLAGFDPTVPLSFSSQRVNVAEGGGGGQVHACLGANAPGRVVDWTLSSGGDQVTVQPSPLRFDVTDWVAPHVLSVNAIDDALAEGPHAAALRFKAHSADAAYDNLVATGLTADIVDNDPGADLALTLVAAPAAAVVNQSVEARYRVTNTGPAASTGATFTFTPLAGLTYVGNSSAVTCTPSTGAVTCTVGPLASGDDVEFTIVLRTQAAGAHANTARITGAEYDANAANDVEVWTLTVN